MKVLFLITRGDTIGGAQTHVLSLVNLLKCNGHEVLVCYGGEKSGPFGKRLDINNINHIEMKSLKREISPFKDFISILRFRKLVNKYKPDIVTLHSSKAGVIGRVSLIFTKFPVLYTVHGWAFTEGINYKKVIFYRSLEKLLALITNKIIVVSNYDKSISIKHRIISPDKIEVVHNGIPILKELQPKDTKIYINLVMIARFDEQKDHESLIRACSTIEKILVHFLGDGPNLCPMKDLVKELKIADKFIFYGYHNNVEQILAKADVFCLISNWEGFPISTLEAMNYSLPVIISNVGGSNEAIDNNKTGFLVMRGNDVSQIKDCIETLINSEKLRKEMGKAGKEKLKKNFSDHVMYNKTMEIYSNLLLKKN